MVIYGDRFTRPSCDTPPGATSWCQRWKSHNWFHDFVMIAFVIWLHYDDCHGVCHDFMMIVKTLWWLSWPHHDDCHALMIMMSFCTGALAHRWWRRGRDQPDIKVASKRWKWWWWWQWWPWRRWWWGRWWWQWWPRCATNNFQLPGFFHGFKHSVSLNRRKQWMRTFFRNWQNVYFCSF